MFRFLGEVLRVCGIWLKFLFFKKFDILVYVWKGAFGVFWVLRRFMGFWVGVKRVGWFNLIWVLVGRSRFLFSIWMLIVVV